MSPRDWILLAIALSPSRSLQPLHLQKALCLIGRKLTHEQLRCSRFYNFEPNEYGPFDAEIYSDVEELEKDGLIITSSEKWPARIYGNTSRGTLHINPLL
ncbi:MAG TPA: hypothetical protein VM164_11310, partial [Burkholderiales bacterium]|nr:hypothetical protein [Burkholderiales bacterium]